MASSLWANINSGQLPDPQTGESDDSSEPEVSSSCSSATGPIVETINGAFDGICVGAREGELDGLSVGISDGADVGWNVGASVGE